MNLLFRLLLRVTIALSVVLAFVRPAVAGDLEEAKRHYATGTRAYEIGAYDEAIKEYGEAYRLIDDPALLFNLGQAHRLAGHTVESLRAYRMFLLKVPDSPNRTEVQQRISELQAQTPLQPKPAPLPSEPAPTESPATPTTAPPTASDVATTAAMDSARAAGRKKLIAGGVVAGAGVLIAVGGVVCGVLAQNAGNDLTRAAQTGQTFDYNKYQSGKTDQTLEIALLAVGGAAVVAGVTVMVLGKRQRSQAHAWLRPLLASGTAGVALDGGF